MKNILNSLLPSDRDDRATCIAVNPLLASGQIFSRMFMSIACPSLKRVKLGMTGLASAWAMARPSPIWRIRTWQAWRLPGRWSDGGRRSTVARWTRRRTAPAYVLIPDLYIFSAILMFRVLLSLKCLFILTYIPSMRATSLHRIKYTTNYDLMTHHYDHELWLMTRHKLCFMSGDERPRLRTS